MLSLLYMKSKKINIIFIILILILTVVSVFVVFKKIGEKDNFLLSYVWNDDIYIWERGKARIIGSGESADLLTTKDGKGLFYVLFEGDKKALYRYNAKKKKSELLCEDIGCAVSFKEKGLLYSEGSNLFFIEGTEKPKLYYKGEGEISKVYAPEEEPYIFFEDGRVVYGEKEISSKALKIFECGKGVAVIEKEAAYRLFYCEEDEKRQIALLSENSFNLTQKNRGEGVYFVTEEEFPLSYFLDDDMAEEDERIRNILKPKDPEYPKYKDFENYALWSEAYHAVVDEYQKEMAEYEAAQKDRERLQVRENIRQSSVKCPTLWYFDGEEKTKVEEFFKEEINVESHCITEFESGLAYSFYDVEELKNSVKISEAEKYFDFSQPIYDSLSTLKEGYTFKGKDKDGFVSAEREGVLYYEEEGKFFALDAEGQKEEIEGEKLYIRKDVVYAVNNNAEAVIQGNL